MLVVYVYGKSEKRAALVDGGLRKTYGHSKPVDRWEVMLKDLHEAYIDWAEFERNQKQLAINMRDKLNHYDMTASMSRKGNCWDYAPTESFFNSLKNERVQATRYETREQAEADLFEYIAVFYNRRRRHSTLRYRSPTQFLEDWLVEQAAQHERAP